MEGEVRQKIKKTKTKKANITHLHQTSIVRDAKGTALRRWSKTEGERGTQVQRGKMAMNKYLPIITLNVNGLSAPIKRHKVAKCIRKHDPHIYCLQETHLRTKDLHRLKVKGWKKYSKQIDMKKKLV